MANQKSRDIKIHQVLTEVLKKITPSEKEQYETKAFIENVLKVTDEVIKPNRLQRTLAGSYMRDTWLPNKKEFDIFILFPESCPREKLERTGLEIGKKITKRLRGEYVIAYAEHPYVRAKVFTKPVTEKSKSLLRKKKVSMGSSYEIDIVPCYAVQSAEKIKSAVDRTPFHNKWLYDNMSPALASQVRLLKQFAKGIGVYGSDAKVLGVSGYLCELLIIQYKSFKNFLDHASKWEAGQVFIDLEEHHKDDREKIMREFKTQPLIVIDPVDPKRNVASNLSPENFVKLVKSSRDFLEKPSEQFFFPEKKKVSVGELKKIEERGTRIIGVKFQKPDMIDDILWPQLRRTSRRLASILKEHEFCVMGHDTYCTEKECIMLFEMEVWSLPKIRKLIGPFVFSKKHSDEFISKYRESGRIWVESSSWVAEIKRKFIQADQKLRDSLKDSEKNLLSKGIASHPAKSISKGFDIMDSKGVLNLAKKNPGFAEFLHSYFTKRVV
ncbi:MAG: CCA tRNA nucleotidyltransferase [Candidatus Aenigmarchaeota archaeon]|nr:CCA tRNA nucleotidyltransferase [Candidatus Aenigmarchaeota archaeon]